MKTQDNKSGGPTTQKNEGNESNSLNKDQNKTTETKTNTNTKSDLREGNDHTEWRDPDVTDPKISPEKVQDPVAKGSYTPDTSTNKDRAQDKTNENVTALGVTEHHSPTNKNDRERHSEEYAGIEEEEEEEFQDEEEDEAAEYSPGEDEEDDWEDSEGFDTDEEDLYEVEEEEETDTNKKKQKGESFKQNLITTKHGSIQDRRGAIVQHNQRNGAMRK
ncbi:MAG: hypothetical protein M3R27_07420 [Bacteroidota bacterium]|nr:hypothetical protein [Bacteroidota bacterium]